MGMLPLFAKDKMPVKRPLPKSENIILFGFWEPGSLRFLNEEVREMSR